jgi:hypothetical protein
LHDSIAARRVDELLSKAYETSTRHVKRQARAAVFASVRIHIEKISFSLCHGVYDATAVVRVALQQHVFEGFSSTAFIINALDDARRRNGKLKTFSS